MMAEEKLPGFENEKGSDEMMPKKALDRAVMYSDFNTPKLKPKK